MKGKIRPPKTPKYTKPMKRLSLNILFRDKTELPDLFAEVLKAVKRGTSEFSNDTPDGCLDLRIEYSPNQDYQERVINGAVCQVYKSKL